jgi:hypothetical protein
VGSERVENPVEWMEMAPLLLDQLLGRSLLVAAQSAPLLEPPLRCARVECADVELVDYDRGSVNENGREPRSDSVSGSTWWSETTATAASKDAGGSASSCRAQALTFAPPGTGSIAKTS